MPLSDNDRRQHVNRGDIEDLINALKGTSTTIDSQAKTWPAGTRFSDRRVLTQDASGGDLSVRYTPGNSTSEFILIGGVIENRDLASRVATAIVTDTGVARLCYVMTNSSLGAGISQTFPTQAANANNLAPSWPGIIVSGTDRLTVTLAAVGSLEDALFEVLLRYVGAAPVVTEVIA